METADGWGLYSLVPLLVTLLLAFTTRSALIAMLTGTFVGTLMLGGVPGASLNQLLQASLGNEDFIWIVLIVVLIGVLFEGFKRAGVMHALAERALAGAAPGGSARSRRKAELTTWGLGFLIVDDYFSPLMTGAVMRPVTDRVGVPREKLAFLLDATTASVCILVPFTAWGAYLASLIAAQGGPVTGVEEGLAVFIRAIPYNFYPMLIICFALLIALRWLPDFGPMRKAEARVAETGALLREGAEALVDEDVDGLDGQAAPTGSAPSLLLELALPVAVVVSVFAWSLLALGSVKIVEAFMAGAAVLIAVLLGRGRLKTAAEVASVISRGAESVMPALIIVALAYALNEVARQLGVGDAIIGLFNTGLSIDWLVPLTFLITAAIAFSTGTSWGSFALMMPVALPVAFSFSAGAESVLVYQTVAAIAGGGIFGDHASPVSDTTVLASLGAGSDHMDHVITQLPYALTMAALTLLIYLLI